METIAEPVTAIEVADAYCRGKRDELELELARVTIVAAALGDHPGVTFSTAYDHVLQVPGVNVWPSDSDNSRKVVGRLIRVFGKKPVFRKWDEAQAEARFELDKMTVMVNSYKGRNCRFVEKKIVVPAKEAHYVEAQPERVETKLIMECDLDSEGDA